MDAFNRACSQLSDWYRSMTPGSRLTAGLLAAVVVAALGYLGTQPTVRPDTNLMHGTPIAANQIPVMEAAFGKAKLKDYCVRGSSIFVPRGQEATYMAALMAANALPPSLGAAGHEFANSGSFMESSQREQQRMKIAKLKDLAQAIRLKPGIEDASVEYDVDLRPGPFKDKVATAIAYVKPTGSNQLDEATVLAIRDMVVSAFAGLKPEDVAVSDLNGRTWHGVIGNTEENRRLSLKHASERDLKARIENALSHIPNAAVEVNVDLNREQAARVLVRVPTSYFNSIWRQRNPAGPGQAKNMPDQAAIDQIRFEESANIQRCVAPLLPLARDPVSLAEMVTVTPFEEISATAPAFNFPENALNWAEQYWKTLAEIGLALVCLLGLRSILRSKPAKVDEPAVAEPAADATPAKPAKVAAPHWRRHAGTADKPLREELSKLVEEDPETAANILSKWIGQVS